VRNDEEMRGGDGQAVKMRVSHFVGVGRNFQRGEEKEEGGDQ